MANVLSSSTLQFSHLKKFTIQNMIYKITLAHFYFYISWGKQKAFIGDNAAVYADVSIFHQYFTVEKKLGSSVVSFQV